MSDTTLPLVGPQALSPAWHALRKFDASRKGQEVVFGATKAAACCGMSPYQTPLDVFVECKLGLEREVTEAMEFGRDFEQAVLNIYKRKRKIPAAGLVCGLPMYIHGRYRWMGATPDAIVDLTERERGGFEQQRWGVDAKTSTYRRLDKDGNDPLKFGVEGTDQMPVDYILQAQQQCAVLNLPYVEFPVLFSRDYCPIYRVDRNEDLIAAIIKAEGEMYERLVNDDPPEPTWEHENTKELIGLLFGRQEDVVKQLEPQDVETWTEVAKAKDQIKELEATVTELTNKLLYSLQGASAGIFPSGREQLKRIVVKESLVTQKDVDDLRERIGQTKRRGYEFLRQTKAKD